MVYNDIQDQSNHLSSLLQWGHQNAWKYAQNSIVLTRTYPEKIGKSYLWYSSSHFIRYTCKYSVLLSCPTDNQSTWSDQSKWSHSWLSFYLFIYCFCIFFHSSMSNLNLLLSQILRRIRIWDHESVLYIYII